MAKPPAPPPIARGRVYTPDTPREPNNPYYRQAKALRAAGDAAGLRALDAQLADAGYAADGITRAFIATALEEA